MMAGPGLSQGGGFCRFIVVVIIAILVILGGLIILITWLIIRPKNPVYSVEDGKVHGFNLQNNHLNGSFDFVIKAYNRNRRVSVYYDSMETIVSYNYQRIAFATIDPFFQPRRNVTRLEVKPVAQNVALSGTVAKDLRVEKSSGVIEFEVRMKAIIRFKVGKWESKHYTLRVLCSPEVHLDPSRAFERVNCYVRT